ncbi:MAG: MqnA/MqnD/SBP family protein, partial [Rikenellaceae bacterium]
MIYIFPTEMEAKPLRQALPAAKIEICGVGLAAAAAAISSIIERSDNHEKLVLCGIAGSYDSQQVSVGEVVEVIEESIEELPKQFAQSYKVEPTTTLKAVSSNSVNSSNHTSHTAQIENMEGASFMALCQAHSRQGVEIRAISNMVGEPVNKWRIDEALESLTRYLVSQHTHHYSLAISPCPNDTFIFDGLVNQRIEMEGMEFDVEYHDIEQLNEIATTKRVDFIKVSAAAIPILYRDYKLSRSGSALGWGNGPLVVRRQGEQNRAMKRVAIPGLSTTATLLLKRYFPEVEQVEPMLFSQIAQAVEQGEVDGGVLIHEGRFTYSKHNLELVADLGELWEVQMQTPLPLGVILMRRDIDPTIQSRFEDGVVRSLEFARANPDSSRWFITEHAQEMES